MGFWSFLIPYFIVKVIISIILKIIILCSRNFLAVKIYKIISNELFFNSFIVMAIEGLFSFIIISYLNLKTIDYGSLIEIYGVVLSYYCIIFSMGILPLTLISTLVFKRYEQIKKKTFI